MVNFHLFSEIRVTEQQLMFLVLQQIFFTLRKRRLHMKTLFGQRYRSIISLFLVVTTLLSVAPAIAKMPGAYIPPANNRIKFNFDYDWKFIKQDVAGAQALA